MPNGGVQPSCFVCKWAKRDRSKPIHPEHNNPLIEPIECEKHGFAVWLPSAHVCADLGDPYDGSGLSTFAETAQLANGFVYAWLEVSLRGKEAPEIPQYRLELVKLAKFQDFSSLTLEQKESAYQEAGRKSEQELSRKLKSDEG